MSRQLNGSVQVHDTAAYRRPYPRWFISRGSGVVVPLIAADELPLDVKLVGVPRGMDLDGAARMEFLGEFLHDGSLYALETPPAEAPAEECTSGEVNGSTAAGTYDDQSHEPHITTRSRPKYHGSHLSHGFGDVHPLYGKKEYCTYWIRTGNCAYARQGCLYKHEMPDLATLERIGFRGIPRWWRVKQSNARILGDRSRYGSEKVSRSVYDRSATSSDESNAEMNDSRSEDGNGNCDDEELDAQATRSPIKCDSPPSAASPAAAAATRKATASVRAGDVTSALDDLIDLSINTASSPSQRNTSDHKTNALTRYRYPPSKPASSHESSNSSLVERRTLSSNSQSAEEVRIKSRHGVESPSRLHTSARRRNKSDSDNPPLDFDPGPIASPTMYQWGDPADTAAMSSDRERKLKSRRAKLSSKTDKFAYT